MLSRWAARATLGTLAVLVCFGCSQVEMPLASGGHIPLGLLGFLILVAIASVAIWWGLLGVVMLIEWLWERAR